MGEGFLPGFRMQADGIDEGAVDVENDRSDQTHPFSDRSNRRNVARQPLPGCLVIEDVGRIPRAR
jgi:hypothetical protein